MLVNDAVAEYDARTFEAADSASATGQTVYNSLVFHSSIIYKILTVVSKITSVTTISLVDSDARAGQLVILAAQLVIV